MTFQEYCELKLAPRAGTDHAFFEAARLEQEEMFPMPPSVVVNRRDISGVNRLAVSWRVYFDYGAAIADHRAAYKAKGEP
jgi:hypothetical protein